MPSHPALVDNVLSWASNLENQAAEQAVRTASLPFVEKPLALMPDAHLGAGSTIGSVIATRGAVIPAAVGVDIGCGMIAAQLDISASDLPNDLNIMPGHIASAIPAGQPKKGNKTSGSHTSLGPIPSAGAHVSLADMHRLHVPVNEERAALQMGTLGGGNHFIELALDWSEQVWLVLHSGSRGVGHTIAQAHIKIAKGLMKDYFIELPDPALAYLVQGTPQFTAYLDDMRWAQDYAAANRLVMFRNTVDAIAHALGHPVSATHEAINCHHNYCTQENHHGKNLWVTRKGAISARAGEYGVIPGSMATGSYIVKGLGSKASYTSASHGAGRAMSRTAARKNLTTESLDTAMSGIAWNEDSEALLDEHPDSYKDLGQVMEDQKDLVEIVTRLSTILNYKGA